MDVTRVPAGQGITWIVDGWRLFCANPVMWVVLTVVYLVGTVLLSLVPLAGSIAVSVLNPAVFAGLLAGARTVDAGGELAPRHLIAALADARQRGPLLVLGALMLAASLAVFVLGALLGGGVTWQALAGGDPGGAGAIGGILLGLLVMLALALPLTMAFVYAPALVYFAAMTPGDALRKSFSACLVNWQPLTVASLVLLPVSLVAMLPFGLGLLVLFPVLVATLWASAKSMFALPAGDGAALEAPSG